MLSELPTSLPATCCQLPSFMTSLPFSQTQVALIPISREASLLLTTSRSSFGQSQLFVITLPTGTVETYPLHEDYACVVAGRDGRAYLGAASGRILCFDPATGELACVGQSATALPLSRGFCSADGTLFFAAADSPQVLILEPNTDKVTTIDAPAAPTSGAICAFTDLPDGRVAAFIDYHPALLRITAATGACDYHDLGHLLLPPSRLQCAVPFDAQSVLIRGVNGRQLLRLNLETFALDETLAPLPEDDTMFYLQQAGDLLLASGVSGALYRFTATGWERLGMPMPQDPLIFAIGPDGRLAGVTFQGRLVHSTSDQRMFKITTLPTCTPNGLAIRAMGISPDRKLYFALAHNMRLGCWDPETDEIAERFVAAPLPGEVTALGFAGERLLIGCADACAVMAFYPELPYRLQENPRLIGQADGAARRPIGPMVHHENNVYFAAAAVTPHEDGAIIRINPLENEVTTFPSIIPRQNLTSLVADRLSGLLVAGGARHAATSSAAALALWSPYEKALTRTVVPFPDADAVYVWAAEGGRIYVTDGGARLSILDSTGELLETGDFPLGPITALITNQHGKLFGLAGGWMFHLDAERQSVERLVEATGSQLTEVRRGLFAYTHHGLIHTVQLW
ncbi:MAG TPA: hypothetical protein VGL77_01340 [Armatimonadota bacterium]|jgi:hypothetical protein